MGIIVVLIFYAIALTILASIAAVVLGMLASFAAKKTPHQRRRAIAVSALFPFACVVFAGCWFVAYATMNGLVRHRDPGLGDGWETPLPNGYALMMIDTTDQGTIYNPKTQPGGGTITSREDAVFGVRQLQIAGPLAFGARDSGYFERIGQNSTAVDTFFELNTKQNKVDDFKTLSDLQHRATAQGVALRLRPFASVFSDYRYSWFDYVAILILLLGPLASLTVLIRWLWRMRKAADSSQIVEVLATSF